MIIINTIFSFCAGQTRRHHRCPRVGSTRGSGRVKAFVYYGGSGRIGWKFLYSVLYFENSISSVIDSWLEWIGPVFSRDFRIGSEI